MIFLGGYFRGLFPFPANAVFAVFEQDAFFEQLIADGVGTGEVALLLGLRALGDEGIDVCVGETERGDNGSVGFV